MTILAASEMYNYANQIEGVFCMRGCGITEMVDVVQTNVDRVREAKVFVYFLAAEVSQIEIEPFQVENQVVRCRLEACPIRSLVPSKQHDMLFTFSQHPQTSLRTTRTCTCYLLP